MRHVLMLIVSLASFITCHAADTHFINGVKYYLDPAKHVATVEKATYNGDILIPGSVTFEGITYPVTTISRYAFEDANLGKVIIEPGLTSINFNAFYNAQFDILVIPETVKNVGEIVVRNQYQTSYLTIYDRDSQRPEPEKEMAVVFLGDTPSASFHKFPASYRKNSDLKYYYSPYEVDEQQGEVSWIKVTDAGDYRKFGYALEPQLDGFEVLDVEFSDDNQNWLQFRQRNVDGNVHTWVNNSDVAEIGKEFKGRLMMKYSPKNGVSDINLTCDLKTCGTTKFTSEIYTRAIQYGIDFSIYIENLGINEAKVGVEEVEHPEKPIYLEKDSESDIHYTCEFSDLRPETTYNFTPFLEFPDGVKIYSEAGAKSATTGKGVYGTFSSGSPIKNLKQKDSTVTLELPSYKSNAKETMYLFLDDKTYDVGLLADKSNGKCVMTISGLKPNRSYCASVDLSLETYFGKYERDYGSGHCFKTAQVSPRSTLKDHSQTSLTFTVTSNYESFIKEMGIAVKNGEEFEYHTADAEGDVVIKAFPKTEISYKPYVITVEGDTICGTDLKTAATDDIEIEITARSSWTKFHGDIKYSVSDDLKLTNLKLFVTGVVGLPSDVEVKIDNDMKYSTGEYLFPDNYYGYYLTYDIEMDNSKRSYNYYGGSVHTSAIRPTVVCDNYTPTSISGRSKRNVPDYFELVEIFTSLYDVSDRKTIRSIEDGEFKFENLTPGNSYKITCFEKIKNQFGYTEIYSSELAVTLPVTYFENTTSVPTSTTSVRLYTETNLSDGVKSVGFEWIRDNAPEGMEPAKAYGSVYNGKIVGTLRGVNASAYYKFRPFYISPAESQSTVHCDYGEWKYFFTGDAMVYFEPEILTIEDNEISENGVNLYAFILEGSSEIKKQGIEYWQVSSVGSYSKASDNKIKVEGDGQFMKIHVSELTRGQKYTYRAFAETSDGKLFYGDECSFQYFDESGVEGVTNDSNGLTVTLHNEIPGHVSASVSAKSAVLWQSYSLNGQILGSGYIDGDGNKYDLFESPCGIVIIIFCDGENTVTRKIMVK